MKVGSDSLTLKNLESAFAGESMANIKYRYFAQQCRAAGDEETAKLFEETAAQEVQHALSHVELIFSGQEMSPTKCLNLAIEGETYEYTEMYPNFRKDAIAEKNNAVVEEIDGQISESKEHAAQFNAQLETAAKRFAALARAEEIHANKYRAALEAIK